MPYSIDEQLSNDIDLFIKCIGFQLHVASAGGLIPESLSRTYNDYNIEIFMNLKRRFDYRLNPNLDEILEFKSPLHKELYLEDFIDKAKKGFFSFDKSNINDPYDKFYHLVAFPKFETCEEMFEVNKLLRVDFNIELEILSNLESLRKLFRKIEIFKGL